jgi:hypothetical protein
MQTCVWVRAHTNCAAHSSTFRRWGPRVARLAGVRPGVGVQREHRRVEHRGGHLLALCMRCSRPAARTAANALGRGSMRVRLGLGAHISAPKRASTFRRRGLRVPRLAGVHVREDVQREHRRVEHRVGVEHGRRMRHFGRRATRSVGIAKSIC